jgi:hypothetical protein
MTKRQRAQVVELLRCAADLWQRGMGGIGAAEVAFVGEQAARPIWKIACRAWESASNSIHPETRFAGWSYGDVCLLAAARVEEGSYP